MSEFGICSVCGEKTKPFLRRCLEHHKCDVCGSRENLIQDKSGIFCQKHWQEKIEKQIEDFHGSTDYTDLITCPYCGHVITDSWEYNDEDGCEVECPHCENVFVLAVQKSLSYSTTKKEGQSNEQE